MRVVELVERHRRHVLERHAGLVHPDLGAGHSTTTGPTTTVPGQVDIVDYDFTPGTTTIKVGERVTWLNRDSVDHWVISAPGTPQPFDLGRQGSAASASHTFDTKGTYPYFCNLHNYMKGEVIVQ